MVSLLSIEEDEMIIDLNTLVDHIDGYFEKTLNIRTGEYRYIGTSDQSKSKSEVKKNEIRLPMITYDELCILYVQELPNNELKGRLLESIETENFAGADSFGQLLHWTIMDGGQYEKWTEFVEKKKRELAKQWCMKNNLEFEDFERKTERDVLEEQLKELENHGNQPCINKKIKIDLRELSRYMRGGGVWESVLNVNTGELRLPSFSKNPNGEFESPQIRRNEIILPSIETIKIIRLYARQLRDKRIREELLNSIDEKDFGKLFQKTLSREGYRDDWNCFCEKKEIEFAKEWCDRNGIGYK